MIYSALVRSWLSPSKLICLILLIRIMHNSFNSSICPFRELSTLWFLRANRCVSNSVRRFYSQIGLFKVLLKVQCSKLFICMLGSQAFDLGVGSGWGGGGGFVGWKFEILGDEVDDKNYKGDPFSDFAFDIFAKSEICISTSKSNATLEFVPEEKRLLIDDEDDQFFFQIRWVLQICQDFNSQDFELIICGIVSAVCIAMYSSSWVNQIN